MANKVVYFVVSGAKGGVGKSTFVLNLASALMMVSKARTCVLDFDTSNCGDLSEMLGVKSPNTISTLAPQLDRMDVRGFYSQVSKHKSGLGILPLYKMKGDLTTLDTAKIDAIFKNLNQIYSFVVVDAGNSFDRFSIKAYEYASMVFFLTTPDILVLSQAERRMMEFRSLQLPAEMFKLILNQFNPRGVIGKEIVQRKLKKDVLAAIMYDSQIPQKAIHDAMPFMMSQPRSPLSKHYADLARFILQPQTMKTLKPPAGAGSIPAHLLQSLNPAMSGGTGTTTATGAAAKEMFSRNAGVRKDRSTQIRLEIHKKLIDKIDLKGFSPEEEAKMDAQKVEELRSKTMATINQLLETDVRDVKSLEERRRLAKEIFDEALGLGALEDLLADPEVSEIMVNGTDQVYVERGGNLTLTNCTFSSEKHLAGIIERIVAPIGRRIDEKTPMVDARLKDGSRVNAIIPPLALNGPTITIRKFAVDPLTYKDLIKFGAFTEEIADFLRACIEAHLNCVISGGTGTGKTTLLNVLSSFIPEKERIITVEDSAELQLRQPHVCSLESRPANLQGENAITIRDLIKNTLRMRPDRIVVGECRGAEALDMLQAMNTGHDGSLTTIHANTPRDCVQRLETLVMFAGYDLPAKAIREQVASAVHMIFQATRFSDGSRRITAITEVVGMEGDTVVLQDIFKYKQTGVTPEGKVKGQFVSTGLIPKFVETLKQKGIRLPAGLFSGGAVGGDPKPQPKPTHVRQVKK